MAGAGDGRRWMLNRGQAVVVQVLRATWHITGEPIYRRLFAIPHRAGINRLNSALGELRDLRLELAALRSEFAEFRAGQEELDTHVRAMVASYWDATAITRRLATIEDRIMVAESAREACEPVDSDSSAR